MRGGSKRARRSFCSSDSGTRGLHHCSPSSDAALEAPDDLEMITCRCPHDSNCNDTGVFASRSSVRQFYEVVSSFDLTKRQLVESTGFGGLLYCPDIKLVNRKFALWLMSAVDENTCSIVIGEHIRIKFTNEDVGCVLGIPCSGKLVLDRRLNSRDSKHKVIESYMGKEFREHRSIKYVVAILEMSYNQPMHRTDEDRFRVAFVIFACSTLLSPSSKYDYASIDYWNAIEDPDSISKYDWGTFVITKLLDAVSKLKQDLSSSIKFPNISGCCIFLQVLYLDSLELGGLSIPHNSFPRIREFGYESYRDMVNADNNFARLYMSNQGSGFSKLRDKSGCCYSWAAMPCSEVDVSMKGCLLAIWDTAVAMVRLLNIPLEAAGPVFVAAADFQDQINSGLLLSGFQVTKFMNVLLSVMLPYTKGFSYEFTLRPDAADVTDVVSSSLSSGMMLIADPVRSKGKHCLPPEQIQVPEAGKHGISCRQVVASSSNSASDKCSSGGRMIQRYSPESDYIQNCIYSAACSIDGVAHQDNINFSVAAVMSKFYSQARKLNVPFGLDLNLIDGGEELVQRTNGVLAGDTITDLPSPWDLGDFWGTNRLNVGSFILKMHRCLNDQGLFIIHRFPKTIQISGRALSMQLLGKSEIEMDLFDAALRVAREDDAVLYAKFGNFRWRHFFESDFMAAVISGAFQLTDAELCEHLYLNNMPYDLSKCKLVFFPALLQHRWVCYAWCLQKNVIFAFDPSNSSPLVESRVQLHERVVHLLKIAMHRVGSVIFGSMEKSWLSAVLHLLTLTERPVAGWNRTGLMCAFFCRCFDGSDIVLNLKLDEVDAVAVKIFGDIIKMKGNCGTIPPSLVHIIQQLSSRVRDVRSRFDAAWARFVELKVDSTTLAGMQGS